MKNLSTVAPSDNASSVTVPNNDIADLRFAMEQQFLKQLQLKNNAKQDENANKDKQGIEVSPSVTNTASISDVAQPVNNNQQDESFKKTVNPNNADSDIICSNCSTKKTPLWRRDENGYILCNACGLFFKLHGKPRPISLKTDVIRSRNRKTKSEKLKMKNGEGGEEKPAPKKRKSNKKLTSPNSTIPTNPLLVNSKSNGLISAAAYLGSNPSSAGSGLIKIVPKSENDYLLQNQQLNGSYQISANQGIVNKVTKPNGIAMYADGSNEQQQNNNGSNFLKPMLSNNSSMSEDKVGLSQRMVSINSIPNLGVTPRLGPIWANNQQQQQNVTSPNGFKSPTMLAIDKLASVSRQVASPLLSSQQDKKYTLPPLTKQDPQNSSTELVSPDPVNKLPNLKNVLINDVKENKGIASISSILSTQANVEEDEKDKQIRTLTTENKELELKLDICKNKIMELERKIYDLENVKTE